MSKKRSTFSYLFEWAGNDAKYIYASIFLAFISSLCAIVPYYIFYRITDEVVSKSITMTSALHFATVLIVIMAIKILTNYLAVLCSHKGAYNTLFKVRSKVTEHMAKMPLGSLNERSTGEIKYVMNESIEKLELFLAHNLSELVLYASGPIIIFIYLCSVNWILGLLSVVPLVIVMIIMFFMFKRFGVFMPEINESSGSFSSSISEYIGGMRLVKAYQMGASSFKKYADGIEKQHNLWVRISKATGYLYAAYVVVLECGVILIVPMSGYLFTQGKITESVLMLFTFIGSRYLTDIRPLQELGNNLSFSMSAIKQVKDILDTPIFGSGTDFPSDCTIHMKNVSFAYEKENMVLNNCSIKISDGERIAIVGKSGAGKSTIVQLISRFYDVSSGELNIGNVNIKDIDYGELLKNISVVFQKNFLTSGSVFENIVMGEKEATLEQVRNAAKKAQIDDFIMALPNGYDTLVGSHGSRFSGGEKQRICIARAILKNAPILILDKATSAADPENQVQIDEAITNLCKDKTVIIVAHRLSVVKNCDRVAVVENGAITHVAPWEQLLEESEYFKKAWHEYTIAKNMEYHAQEGENHDQITV